MEQEPSQPQPGYARQPPPPGQPAYPPPGQYQQPPPGQYHQPPPGQYQQPPPGQYQQPPPGQYQQPPPGQYQQPPLQQTSNNIVVVQQPGQQPVVQNTYVKKNSPNHLLHCIITFFCPWWIFIWIIVCCVSGC